MLLKQSFFRFHTYRRALKYIKWFLSKSMLVLHPSNFRSLFPCHQILWESVTVSLNYRIRVYTYLVVQCLHLDSPVKIVSILRMSAQAIKLKLILRPCVCILHIADLGEIFTIEWSFYRRTQLILQNCYPITFLHSFSHFLPTFPCLLILTVKIKRFSQLTWQENKTFYFDSLTPCRWQKETCLV